MSLMLDPRQRAMLAEMGVKVWMPAHPALVTPEAAAEPDAPAASALAPTTLAASVAPSAAAVPAVSAPVVAQRFAGMQNAQSTSTAAFLSPGTPLAALQQAVAAQTAASPSPNDVEPVEPAQAAPGPTTARADLALVPVVAASHGATTHSELVSNHQTQNISGYDSIPQDQEASPKTRTPAHVAPAPVIAHLPVLPAGSVADMGWDELRATVAACQACGLCESRKQTVFGVGAQRADWMVVGEAPGEQEDLRGEPFVGPAGQLLDDMLRAVGVSRLAVHADPSDPTDQAAETAPAIKAEQAVFIANVLKCRPPVNRNPLPAEIAQCQPYLRRQVALVQPNIILAMGRFAVQALLGTTEPIGRLRQQVHSYQGVPVIVTYHPAYLLRNLPEKAKAWADLVLAMQVAKSSPHALGMQSSSSGTVGD